MCDLKHLTEQLDTVLERGDRCKAGTYYRMSQCGQLYLESFSEHMPHTGTVVSTISSNIRPMLRVKMVRLESEFGCEVEVDLIYIFFQSCSRTSPQRTR